MIEAGVAALYWGVPSEGMNENEARIAVVEIITAMLESDGNYMPDVGRGCGAGDGIHVTEEMIDAGVQEMNWLLPNPDFSADEKRAAMLEILFAAFGTKQRPAAGRRG